MKKPGKSSESSDGGTNYTDIRVTKSQMVWIFGKSLLIVILLALLFYDSLIAVLFLLPVLAVLIRKEILQVRENRIRELKKQFRECLLSVSAGLSAGYSPENAFRRAAGELAMLYGEDQDIMKELHGFERHLDMNESLEVILADFAQRSGMEEARSFSEVFVYAKRSGGNLNRILRSAAQQIGEKIEVEREIRTVTAEKRMEQQILNIIPIAICIYLKLASPGYLDVLYKNPAGIAVMSVCLGVYIAAYLISERIVSVEI